VSIRSGGITPVMTFQDASGLSVWCGRGVRSGKNRDFWVEGEGALVELEKEAEGRFLEEL